MKETRPTKQGKVEVEFWERVFICLLQSGVVAEASLINSNNRAEPLRKGKSEPFTWGKSAPDRRNSWCKGPGAGVCPAFLRNSEEAGMAGAESAKKEGWRSWSHRESRDSPGHPRKERT